MPKVTPVFDVSARGLRGMVRQSESGNLPPNVARLHQNGRLQDRNAVRRPGCVRVGVAPADTGGLVTFDGASFYGSWPDIAAYDLLTKWAILVWLKLPAGAPVGTQYILSRDVTPTTAGKITARLGVNTSRRLFFDMHAGGAAFPLAAAPATAIAASTKAAALIVRDGVDLALHLDGNPTPAASRSDLPGGTPNNAGAAALQIARNWDGTTATGYFNGSVGCVTIFRDYDSVEDLLKYTTFQKYPDPLDPRVILHSPFNYGEDATDMTDWSSLGNDGTLVGAVRADGASMGAYTQRSQAIFTFGKPYEGTLKNCWLVGGKLYAQTVRAGV